MAEIAALLLAAGESVRMGEIKALLPWRGKTLIEYQVASLESAGVSQTIVVLGYRSEKLEPLLKGRPAVECVYNPDYAQGKTTSIKAGLRALQRVQGSLSGASDENSLLVLNVDQPRSSETIRRIVGLHYSRTGGDGPPGSSHLITVPTYRGRGGHPIVLSASLMAEMMDISEDNLGLKAVARRHEGDTQRVELGSPEILLDLNTPQDYQEALETSPLG